MVSFFSRRAALAVVCGLLVAALHAETRRPIVYAAGYGRSRLEIAEVWKRYKPSAETDPYVYAPEVGGEYALGALSWRFADDGLRMTNFIRYLAGLPDTVVIDPMLSDTAQHGAVLLAASQEFSHEPPKPAGMPEDFYRTGLSSTMRSNIARGFHTIESAIQHGYVRDDDPYNLKAIGHRRWILNPSLAYTGFGFADRNTTMQVTDKSGPSVVYDYIAWPAPGAFPREFFDADDPWTITLNPDTYRKPEIASIRIELTRLSDGRVWQLNWWDCVINTVGEYFNVNTEGYGIPNVIIFRPVPAEVAVKDATNVMGDNLIVDDSFRVSVTGIQYADGKPAEFSYTVTFFDLENGGRTERPWFTDVTSRNR